MSGNNFQTKSDFKSHGEESPYYLPNFLPPELGELSDEELCRKARGGCVASIDLLWKRHAAFIRAVVYEQNKHQHLPPYEIPDVLQELYFAFHVSVQRYDPENHCHGKPASFKTFLKIVVTHAFSTYCTLWRIYHKHIAMNFDNDALSRFIAEVKEANHSSFYQIDKNGQTSFDWQVMLLGESSSDRLAGILKQLKPKEKHLLEVWLQYGRDKDVAQILGISPVAAKLRRERLFCRIRQSVAKH